MKEEMRRLGSLIIRAGEAARVPAGAALAVDREIFSQQIMEAIRNHPKITVLHEEVKEIPADGVVIMATGPLTSDALGESLRNLTRSDYLYFFDAISPIIDAESINDEITFRASRYDKGGTTTSTARWMRRNITPFMMH